MNAKEAAIHHEVVKVASRQAKEGGWLITIRTHPDDPSDDLATSRIGQRFAAAFVPLKDTE